MEDLVRTRSIPRETIANARVLVTGHTGFKGGWLCMFLEQLGAEVFGYSLPPPTSPSLFEDAEVEGSCAKSVVGDVRDFDLLSKTILDVKPNVIFHLAAQALVLRGYENPRETFETNVLGTLNLLESLRRRGQPTVVVVVTSDKCYRESKDHEAFREDDPLGGNDPYSASKGAAELVSEAYLRSFFDCEESGIRLATVRAGNVIGGGDWSEDRVVPDVVRALSLGEPVRLRHPEAVRPWQHVLDPLSGYVLLAESLLGSNATDYVGAWNFGPAAGGDLTVASLVSKFISEWGDGSWTHSRPNLNLPEMECLRLDVTKSCTKLGWIPRWDVETAVDKTARWYKATHRGELDARTASLIDIEDWSSVKEHAGGTT